MVLDFAGAILFAACTIGRNMTCHNVRWIQQYWMMWIGTRHGTARYHWMFSKILCNSCHNINKTPQHSKHLIRTAALQLKYGTASKSSIHLNTNATTIDAIPQAAIYHGMKSSPYMHNVSMHQHARWECLRKLVAVVKQWYLLDNVVVTIVNSEFKSKQVTFYLNTSTMGGINTFHHASWHVQPGAKRNLHLDLLQQ